MMQLGPVMFGGTPDITQLIVQSKIYGRYNYKPVYIVLCTNDSTLQILCPRSCKKLIHLME